jgi:D-glycero-D-manno-heptose 1,7-bisphosphate phosphatase
MSLPLVILDRDGVINQDSRAYIKTAEEWIPIEGSLDAIARLKRAGFNVAVATNQSGLARGLFDLAALEQMHDRLRALLAQRGCALDYLAYCPHGPDDNCDCRKPKPGLYLQIAQALGKSLSDAIVIGDSARDLQAAEAVGARRILVLSGKGRDTLLSGQLPVDTAVYEDLSSAVDGILSDPRNQSDTISPMA